MTYPHKETIVLETIWLFKNLICATLVFLVIVVQQPGCHRAIFGQLPFFSFSEFQANSSEVLFSTTKYPQQCNQIMDLFHVPTCRKDLKLWNDSDTTLCK